MGSLAGLLMFVTGLLVTLAGLLFSPYAVIVGLLLCLVGAVIGGRKSKVWRCCDCRIVVPRG